MVEIGELGVKLGLDKRFGPHIQANHTLTLTLANHIQKIW